MSGYEEFDLNSMDLLDLPCPDEGQGEPAASVPAPPSDGVYWAGLGMRPAQEGRENVYVKAMETGAKILARFTPRFLREDGTLGAYMKDFYPSNQMREGQSVSDLGYIARLAGVSVPRGNFGQLLQFYKDLFASLESEPGSYIAVPVVSEWIKSTPRVDENGEVVRGADGRVEYDEIRGERRIKAAAVATAQMEASRLNLSGDAFDRYVAQAAATAHLYTNPVTGEQNQVRAQVRRLAPQVEAGPKPPRIETGF